MLYVIVLDRKGTLVGATHVAHGPFKTLEIAEQKCEELFEKSEFNVVVITTTVPQ